MSDYLARLTATADTYRSELTKIEGDANLSEQGKMRRLADLREHRMGELVDFARWALDDAGADVDRSEQAVLEAIAAVPQVDAVALQWRAAEIEAELRRSAATGATATAGLDIIEQFAERARKTDDTTTLQALRVAAVTTFEAVGRAGVTEDKVRLGRIERGFGADKRAEILDLDKLEAANRAAVEAHRQALRAVRNVGLQLDPQRASKLESGEPTDLERAVAGTEAFTPRPGGVVAPATAD